jgi:hypothetical protein
MATIKKGILGGITGKLDGLYGSKRGIHDTITVNPRIDDIEWSVQTQNERTRMAFLSALFKQIPSDVFAQMFIEGPKDTPRFFRMIRANYEFATASSYTPHLDMIPYASIPRPITFNTWFQLLPSGATTFTWRAAPARQNESATDICERFLYFPAINQMLRLSNVRTRNQLSSTSNTGARPSGMVVYPIMFFLSADGKRSSYVKTMRYVVP